MKKIYKILLVGFLILITIIIFSINSIVKSILISTVKDKTGKDISISTLWINPFSGNISAKGIDLLEGETSIFSLKSFKLNSDPIKLAKGTLYIDEVTLIEPTINIGKKEQVSKVEDSNNNKEGAASNSIDESSEVSTPVLVKEESAPEITKKESFIKEVTVKNITVKNLVLEGNESQFKSLNTFTLEVPNFVYKDDVLNLSAVLDIIDSGTLDLSISANTNSGEIEGGLSSDQLLLNTTFNQDKEIFNTKTTFKGKLDFLGNYIEKNINTNGAIELRDTEISDSNNTPLLLSEKVDINIEELSYPNLKVLSTGTYQINLTSEVLPIVLKDKPDIKIGFQGGSVDGNFDLDYPALNVRPTIHAEEIIVQDTEELPYKGSLKILDGNYDLSLDLLKKLTTVTGVTNLNTLDFADTKKNSLFFRDGQINIEFSSNENTNNFLVKNMKFSNGEISAGENKLEDVSLDISNVTSKKIDSPVIFSASGEDFAKVSAKLKVFAEDMDEFSDLKVSGDLNIDTLKLESIKNFVEDFSYDMGGVISSNSYISYSKDNITSVGNISGTNFKMTDEDMNLSMDSFNSNLDITIKEDDIESRGKVSANNFKMINKEMNLSMNNFNSDINITMKKDDITSKGNLSGANLKIKDKDMDLSINSFNSTLDLLMKKDILTLNNTDLAFKNITGKIDKETEVSLPDGKISIKKYTAEDINLNSFVLNSPVITAYKISDDKSKSTNQTNTQVSQASQKNTTSKTSETKVTKSTTNTEAESADKTKEEAPLPSLYIGSLDINNATYTENLDGKKTIYRDIDFTSRNFNSRKNEEFTVDGSASLDGIKGIYLKGNTTLTKDWEFDPKTIKFNGTLGVTEITLSKFNDTLSKSLPNKIEKGTLSSTGSLKLNKGIIDSKNKMELSDLKLGAATGITSRVPLQRVIDSLKNNDGTINIDVPVEGDLNDPEFGVAKIVLNALIANFSNILKNPEKAISTILTIGSSDKEGVIYFDYLDSRPKSSDIDKLDKTLELMKANPDSKLKVTLFTNDKVEEGIMKTKNLAGSLFGNKKDDSEDKLDELMEKRKDYILDYLTKEIDESRIEITISDRDKSLPQAKLEIIK